MKTRRINDYIRKLLCFIISLILIFSVVILNVRAYPTIDSINLPIETQQKSHWCWAACGASILNYYGVYVSQGDFSITVKGNITNNDPATIYPEVQNGLLYYGLTNHGFAGTLSFSSIQSNIYVYERPILARLEKSNHNGSHLVVLMGYNMSLGNDVMYMNPSYSSYQYDTYSSFVSNTYYYWTHTLDNFGA